MNTKNQLILSGLFILLVIPLTPLIFAPPNAPLCFEDGSLCDFVNSPFNALSQPYLAVFGVWFYPIIYGIFLGIIWHRSKDPMLVGVIGIMMATLGIGAGVIDDFNQEFILVGAGLLALAIGVTLYQVIHKLQSPSS